MADFADRYWTSADGIKLHYRDYAGPLDRCSIDGQRVVPQPGGFYGGWITPDLAGPFKGVPGSMGW